MVAYFGASPADFAAALTRMPPVYAFEDGTTLYGHDVARASAPPSPEANVQWTRFGVSKGAYVTVASGIGASASTGRGRGTAYVLSNAVAAAGGAQRLMLFRSSNLDWGAVDEKTLSIDAASQQMTLSEGSQRLASTGYAAHSGLSATEEGVQPAHLSASFVDFLDERITPSRWARTTAARSRRRPSASGRRGSAERRRALLGRRGRRRVRQEARPEDRRRRRPETLFLKLYDVNDDTKFSVSGTGHVFCKTIGHVSDERLKQQIAVEDTCLDASRTSSA